MKFTFVSPHAENILGFEIDEWFEGDNFFKKTMPLDDQNLLKTALERVHHSEGDVEIEHRMVRKDGATLWFKTNIRLSESENGKEYRGLCVDITNLKETEESLREMIHVRDEFLSVASHELKTPLTPLQLQVESFKKLFDEGKLLKAPEKTLGRMLSTSVAQVDILVKLIDQLLDVSRVTSGKIELSKSPTDLVKCVLNVANLFQNELQAKKIDLKLRHPKNLVGNWDKVRIEQVIVNLVQNAIKYGDGSPIGIDISLSGGMALVAVSDSGIGIAESDHSRIFGRYERAVPKSSFSGLGLGLYISKQLIEIHGGRIWVESEIGKRSAFFVELPLDA